MKSLIGLAGQKGVGKDTTGNYMSELTEYPLYAFAGPLKEFCKSYFDLSDAEVYGDLKEKNRGFNLKSWRNLLFAVLEFHFPGVMKSKEEIDKHFYRNVLLPYLFSENEINQTAKIVTSPREIMQRVGTNFFRSIDSDFWINQAGRALEERGSLILTDVRFDNEAQWIKDNGGIVVSIVRDLDNKDYHVSEKGVSREYVDIFLENNGSIEELRNGIEMLVEYNIKGNNNIRVEK